MTEFTTSQILMEMNIISECSEKQLCSKQDAAALLSIEQEEGWIKESGDQPIDIIAVFDGHGPDLVIDIIRKLNLYEHFASSNPAESIQKDIDMQIQIKKEEINKVHYVVGTSFRNYMSNKITSTTIARSGTTFSFAKIYRNTETKKVKIVAEWLGDSPIIVFINGELVFKSEIHHAVNDAEVQRLLQNNTILGTEKSRQGFSVLNEDTIAINPGKYIVLKTNDLLSVTRSLGHGRVLGVETQKHVIECSTEDEVKVITFSDGVGDVLHMDYDLEKLKMFSADEIVELAEQRWKQEWKCGEKFVKFSSNGYDDCCCAIWMQKKSE